MTQNMRLAGETTGLHAHVSSVKGQPSSTPNIAIWEPPSLQQGRSAAPVAIPIECELIAAIERPLRAGETHRVGCDRKEREVAALLDQLTPLQSLSLSKRLAVNAANDPLVMAFGRMVVERRNRLVAFLAHRRLRAVTR